MSNLDSLVVAFCGKRKSGKTYLLIQQLLNERRDHYDLIIIVSSTWNLQPQTEALADENVLVFNKFDGIIFDKIKLFLSLYPELHLLVILDDIAMHYRKDPEALDELITMGRHLTKRGRMDIFILCQRIRQLTTTARGQLDELYLFAEPNLRELHALYDDFGNGMKFEEFIRILSDATRERYSYMKIVNEYGRLVYYTAPTASTTASSSRS
jgi:hypothetical protein